MAIRKNKKFIDPRYFMDEKTGLTEARLPAWERPGNVPPVEDRLAAIVKKRKQAKGSYELESLNDLEPQTIAQFAWEEGIRLQDFGEPSKEPRLTMADKKRVVQILGDEAEVEIDGWGDPVISEPAGNKRFDFMNFMDKVVSALWHKHKQAEEDTGERDYYADESAYDTGY